MWYTEQKNKRTAGEFTVNLKKLIKELEVETDKERATETIQKIDSLIKAFSEWNRLVI